ncbi:MAG TPA: hypothetical protein VMW87_04520 [Spirochaetia bacterium]|nr:hypothetical protein [Spirochaetia bacterium]
MTASQIIDRALTLADLVGSSFLTMIDKIQSINEAYRDLYGKILESNDDYYWTEKIFALSPANQGSGPYEWLYPLPSDFMKLRSLDYSGGVGWMPTRKFNLGMKDYNPFTPYYRMQGKNLWIIGGSLSNPIGNYRLAYYPPPSFITVPNIDIPFGESYQPSQVPSISSPFYVAAGHGMLYVYFDGTNYNIRYESSDAGSNLASEAPITLLTQAAAITNLVYYKGVLYWLQAGDIYAAETNLAATITPVKFSNVANITSFSINANTIFYTDGTNTSSSPRYAFAATVLWAGVVASGVYRLILGAYTYLSAGSVWYKPVSGAAVNVADGPYSACTNDGTYLYGLDASGVLWQGALTLSSTGVPSVSWTELHSDVAILGNVYSTASYVEDYNEGDNWVSVVLAEENSLVAISANADYSFDYPSNLLTECMAYQCAVDFKRKQAPEQSAFLQNELKMRLSEKQDEFLTYLKRDENMPERIRNAYADMSNIFGMW